MPIVLLVKTKDQEAIEIPVLGKTTIGRSSSCDCPIDDKQMSGKHGRFEVDHKGQLFYTDLDSTNGSFLNNNKVQRVQLKLNEILRLGNTEIRIDRNRLSKKEVLEVGTGKVESSERTFMVSETATRSVIQEKAHSAKAVEEAKKPLKKGIVLNKDLKKKKMVTDENWNKKDPVIEQEETGKTKFLKLDVVPPKKKK